MASPYYPVESTSPLDQQTTYRSAVTYSDDPIPAQYGDLGLSGIEMEEHMKPDPPKHTDSTYSTGTLFPSKGSSTSLLPNTNIPLTTQLSRHSPSSTTLRTTSTLSTPRMRSSHTKTIREGSLSISWLVALVDSSSRCYYAEDTFLQLEYGSTEMHRPKARRGCTIQSRLQSVSQWVSILPVRLRTWH